MKFTTATILLFLPTLTLGSHIPECSDYGVTDMASCLEWCGGEGHLDAVTSHADTIHGLHVEKLRGMECHCEDHRLLAEGEEEGGDHDHDEETVQSCWIGYKLPTCVASGVEECSDEHHDDEGEMEMVDFEADSNITDVTATARSGSGMSCADLCTSLGLGEILKNEESACSHVDHDVNDGGDHSSHNHRFMAQVTIIEEQAEEEVGHDEDGHDEEGHGDEHGEEDEHEHTEDHFTMCFCGASQPGEEGVLVCADEGWEGQGHEASMTASSANFMKSTFAILAVGASLWMMV